MKNFIFMTCSNCNDKSAQVVAGQTRMFMCGKCGILYCIIWRDGDYTLEAIGSRERRAQHSDKETNG